MAKHIEVTAVASKPKLTIEEKRALFTHLDAAIARRDKAIAAVDAACANIESSLRESGDANPCGPWLRDGVEVSLVKRGERFILRTQRKIAEVI